MIKIINREQLLDLIGNKKSLKIVDVLSSAHYEQEHIKGAISLPVDEVEDNADKLLNRDDLIVTYCASFECKASTNAAEKLQGLGFKHVLDYKGGLKDYKAANLPLEGSIHQAADQAVCDCTIC